MVSLRFEMLCPHSDAVSHQDGLKPAAAWFLLFFICGFFARPGEKTTDVGISQRAALSLPFVKLRMYGSMVLPIFMFVVVWLRQAGRNQTTTNAWDVI